jgi:hypothetical protein
MIYCFTSLISFLQSYNKSSTMTDSNNFPHAVLTPLPPTRPTAATLTLLQQELNANAISVASRRGDGFLGHYQLVVAPATYTAASLNNVVFDPPVNPGLQPIHARAATPAEITETNRQYLANQREFLLYTTTEAQLKRLVLAAVPSTYTNALKDRTLGFANVTTVTILTHLKDTYGTITTDDLDRNMALLHRDWSPSEPIENLFEQIRQCREFAADTDPISEAMALRAGLMTLEKSGLFDDAIRDWRKRPAIQQTLENFATDFKLADGERHCKQTTTTAGYHNTAASVNHTTTAFAGLTVHPTVPDKQQLYYCWSHGAGRNPLHTSLTCINQQPGHRGDATMYNMLGGCNLIHRARNEKPVYQAPTKPDKPGAV